MEIHFYPTRALPAVVWLRELEELALADRAQLGLRFGEPCDPRLLAGAYDITRIVETLADWSVYRQAPGQQVQGWLRELEGWSGTTLPLPTGEHLLLVNGLDARTRRTLTIAHELGHLVLGHTPLALGHAVQFHEGDALRHLPLVQGCAGRQEEEATAYALALLLPYAPLLQLLAQGAPLPAIAAHYRVSSDALDGRVRHLGLQAQIAPAAAPRPRLAF